MTSTNKFEPLLHNLRNYYATHITKTYKWRLSQLNALLRLITENEEAVVDALTKDFNKPAFETYGSEIIASAVEVRAAIANLSAWMKPHSVSTPLSLLPASSAIHYEPKGVVLLIGPFNYPFQLCMLPLLAAIGAGNCVVLKPSELTPNVSALVERLVVKYLDPNAVAVVQGSVPETTALLKLKWDHIFFTGSEFVGRIVLRAAAEHLTPCTLELGGKSPVIVDESADLTVTARRIIWGKCFNTGQSCIAPDYVCVSSSIKDVFLVTLQKTLIEFYGENPHNNPDFGRIVNLRHTERIAKLLEGHAENIVVGGQIIPGENYVAPTVVDLKSLERLQVSPLTSEEIFGPILPVMGYDDLASVIHYINSKPKPLALYIFSKNSKNIDRIVKETSSGGVCVNDTMVHYANHSLPFGGIGNSGIGNYHGEFGFQTFSHPKSLLHKSFMGDSPIRYAPYSAKNLKLYRYVAEIYRVNSKSFRKLLWIFLPLVVAGVAIFAGVTCAAKL